ncbi:MAG: SUMF1/EgtB/PvdO family nonheme iron enzyme [Candidatus Symbiothrix sp.]|jgi:formylglycine-generating enzyme required for sulfatase activity|nr:SUMF1/EgtB/PvdO family nonheme iron enzyme [Candidatus Symbiothrix sp.]
MKKYLSLILLATLAMFSGCSSDNETPVTGISLEKTTLELLIGDSATLIATVLPTDADNKTVAWSSSDDTKATVDNNGKVTAVALGKVTITAKAGDKTTTCAVDVVLLEMVSVQGGTTTLNGTNVTLSSFAIGKYEVTQKQWWDVMGSWPGTAPSSTYGEGDNYPMYFVNYTDIQGFLTKLNQQTGKNYRLPTEAEWEYAAQGGQSTHNYDYSGSNTIGNVAWYDENSGYKNRVTPYSHIIGTKAPNELGIYDMSGNVGEWCSDWLDITFPYTTKNPTGSPSGTLKVVRGGCWMDYAGRCHVSYRDYYDPDKYRNPELGYRLVVSL